MCMQKYKINNKNALHDGKVGGTQTLPRRKRKTAAWLGLVGLARLAWLGQGLAWLTWFGSFCVALGVVHI